MKEEKVSFLSSHPEGDAGETDSALLLLPVQRLHGHPLEVVDGDIIRPLPISLFLLESHHFSLQVPLLLFQLVFGLSVSLLQVCLRIFQLLLLLPDLPLEHLLHLFFHLEQLVGVLPALLFNLSQRVLQKRIY